MSNRTNSIGQNIARHSKTGLEFFDEIMLGKLARQRLPKNRKWMKTSKKKEKKEIII
jgi:hypothetical protein